MNAKHIVTAVTVALIGFSASGVYAQSGAPSAGEPRVSEAVSPLTGGELTHVRDYSGFNNATDE